ncbi:MAG: hypothetical protein JXQ73_10530 [Phycisphaerae bacterium]|nr:hypothetical protein [Phycisphaerae bacterium]
MTRWLVLALTLCVPAAGVGQAVAERAGARVALLSDGIAGLDRSLVGEIARRLQQATFATALLRCEELADGKTFSRGRFDVLILCHSPAFPMIARENLVRFLEQGGHLVLMGGRAFSTPVIRYGSRWCTWAEAAESLSSVPAAQVFFDFGDGVSGWTRSSSEPGRPTKLATDRGRAGRCMRIEIKGLDDGWDTHAAKLPTPFAEGANALSFWAKATKNTPQMAVELDEQDGSRWVAVVDVGDQWKRYLLTAPRFKFWRDGSSRERGDKDRVDFGKVRRVSFGVAFGLTSQPPGDHMLWIDEIGSAKVEVPAGADVAEPLDLGVFSDDEVHRLGDIERVVTARGQDVLGRDVTVSGRFAGTSAVGFALPARSEFIPVLAALDRYGRNRGWAGGLLVHYDGPFKGSNWVLFGIESREFYRHVVFGEALVDLLTTIGRGDLAGKARAADVESRRVRIELKTPPPGGFLRLSEDRKHILYPDGRRIFMFGANYLGPCDRKCYIGGDLFDARRIEDDFRKCRDAGINILRFWLNGVERDPGKVATVKELARRYGVYLLLHLGPHATTSEKIVDAIMPAVRAFKDEPMVLGYDLINEPYLGTVGAITIDGRPSALLALRPYETFEGEFSKTWVDGCVKSRPEWPQMHKWLDEKDARELYAAYSLWNRYAARYRIGGYSTFPGLKGLLPVDGKFGRFIKGVDETFGAWIKFQVEAIRSEDKRHLITVGYNTALSCLPANERLDFVSQHVYEKPGTLETVMRNVTTMDRLAKAWPRQPITLGEFGYSNGIRVAGGYLDPDASGVGEMIHYLYALAHGYDGCMKWSLTDWPLAVIRYNAPWIQGASKQVYESRFGAYSYDGTIEGRPKPIAHALKFLRDYVDRYGPGGELRVTGSKTPIGAAYVYRSREALFVGDVAHEAPEFRFRADVPTSVMLMRDRGALRVMATRDVTLSLNPSAFVGSITASTAKVEGRTASTGRAEAGRLVLEMLAGETVTIR